MAGENLEHNSRLIAQVMRIHRLPSERAAIDYALRRLVPDPELAAEPLSRDEALAMRGSGWVIAPYPAADRGTRGS